MIDNPRSYLDSGGFPIPTTASLPLALALSLSPSPSPALAPPPAESNSVPEMDAASFCPSAAESNSVPKMDGASFARWVEAQFGPEVVPGWLDFILDSGASRHMVRDPDFLCKIRQLLSPVRVEAADGKKLSVTAIGDIDSKLIKLKDVYLVPELAMNLISVLQLARDHDIRTTFGKDSADLFKGEEPVGGAIAEGDLYKVRFVWASGDAAPHTSPAATGEHITSYVANVASSNMKDLVTSLKINKADWVTSLEAKEAIKEAYCVTSLMAKEADWMISPKAKEIGWVKSFKAKEADWVTSPKGKEIGWVTSFKAKEADLETSLKASTSFKAKEADLVTSLKAKEAGWVTGFEDSAVLVDWVESFKDKSMICGDLSALTAKMDESDEIGGAAGCNSIIRDGSLLPGNTHLGSEGMHGTNFMKVQLNA